MKTSIDPRTTRRRVQTSHFHRNSALYASFRILGYEGEFVVLERTKESLEKEAARAPARPNS